MKLILFIENNQYGGLNTFCSNLVNSWPDSDDKFLIICNNGHPGKINLKDSIQRKETEFLFHNVPISWQLSRKYLGFMPHKFSRIFQPFFRIFLYKFQLRMISNLFKKNNADDLIVVNGGYPGGETCRIANIAWFSLYNKKSIHNFHNYAVKPRYGFGWFENKIDRLTLKSTKNFITVSNSCLDSLSNREVLKNIKNKRVIYNGIVPDYSSSGEKIRKNLGIVNAPLCSMLANYEPRKGHKFVLKAFDIVLDKFPNAHLVFAGGGSDKEIDQIRKYKEEINKSENIHILNFLPGHDLIKGSNVILIGSQEFESFGLTAIEAMFFKKPIVSTNVGGLKEVIGLDGVAGLIADKENYTEFAENIIKLLEDNSFSSEISSCGFQRANKLFTAQRMSRDYYKILRD